MKESDGSIVVDTEIDPEGFQKDSVKLQNAIRSLNKKVENLRPTFNKAITGSASALSSFNAKAGALEQTIADIEDEMAALAKKRVPTEEYQEACKSVEKYKEKLAALEARQEKLANRGVSENSSQWKNLTSDIDLIYDKLERAVEAKRNFEKLGGAYISGADTTQYSQLKSNLDAVKAKMKEMQNVGKYTDVLNLSADIEKVEVQVDKLTEKYNRLKGTGVSLKSQSWKNLSYDILMANEQIEKYRVLFHSLSATGSVPKSTFGLISEELVKVQSNLDAVKAKISDTQHKTSKTNSLFGKMVQHIKGVASGAGRAAATIGGKLLSGAKSAASHIAKMVRNSKGLKGSFGGALSSIKKIAPALLSARGIMGILRKSVSAYMEENESLKNTLNAAWSGIGNLLGPIITKLVNMLATALAYTTKFFGMFAGYGNSVAKSMNKASGAAKKTTKELKRQLAPFDELNQLSDNSDKSKDSGTLPDVTLPDWAKQIADQIKAGNWGEAAKTLANKLNSMIDGIDWAKLGQKIGKYIDEALAFLANFIETFDWYGLGVKFATFINNIISSVDWSNLGVVLGAKFKIAIESLGGFFSTLDWAGLGKALADCFMGLWNSIDWAQAGKMVSDGVKGILTTLTDLLSNTDWKQIGSDVATFINSIDWAGVFAQIVSFVSEGLTGALDLVLGFVETIDWGKLADDLFDSLISLITNIDWGKLLSQLVELIGSIWGAKVSIFAALILDIWNLLKDAWNSVKSYFNEYIEEAGGDVWDGFKNGILDAFKNVGIWIRDNLFQPFIAGFCSAFGIHSPSKVMKEQGGYIVSGLQNGLSANWQKITGFFSGKIGEVISSLKNKDWKSIGRNICDGISNGLSEKWEWLKNKVANIASSLLEKAKNVLGIHSPSRLFRDQVGLNIGLGVGEGVENSTPAVLKTTSNLAKAISDEFNSGDYVLNMGIKTSRINNGLSVFSDKITDSFSLLIDRLQSIADTVTFKMPATAKSSVLPYSVSSGYVSNSSYKTSALEFDMAVFKQAFREALSESGGGAGGSMTINLVIDRDIVGKAFVEYHNGVVARTRMSPLKGVG